MSNQFKNISKLLSLVLRHEPSKIGIQLDTNGWTDVEILLKQINKNRIKIDLKLLKEVVAENDKQRFSFNEDGSKIRANQGHSVNIELALKAITPPDYLYHGTVGKFMEAIRKNGLLKMSRQHVHLSKDIETAQKVGSRRGKPTILTVRTGAMYQDGFEFYQSENGVWLTDHVPTKYIEFK